MASRLTSDPRPFDEFTPPSVGTTFSRDRNPKKRVGDEITAPSRTMPQPGAIVPPFRVVLSVRDQNIVPVSLSVNQSVVPKTLSIIDSKALSLILKSSFENVFEILKKNQNQSVETLNEILMIFLEQAFSESPELFNLVLKEVLNFSKNYVREKGTSFKFSEAFFKLMQKVKNHPNYLDFTLKNSKDEKVKCNSVVISIYLPEVTGKTLLIDANTSDLKDFANYLHFFIVNPECPLLHLLKMFCLTDQLKSPLKDYFYKMLLTRADYTNIHLNAREPLDYFTLLLYFALFIRSEALFKKIIEHPLEINWAGLFSKITECINQKFLQDMAGYALPSINLFLDYLYNADPTKNRYIAACKNAPGEIAEQQSQRLLTLFNNPLFATKTLKIGKRNFYLTDFIMEFCLHNITNGSADATKAFKTEEIAEIILKLLHVPYDNWDIQTRQQTLIDIGKMSLENLTTLHSLASWLNQKTLVELISALVNQLSFLQLRR